MNGPYRRANLKRMIMAAFVGTLSVLQIVNAVPVQALGKPTDSSSVMNPLINEVTTPLASGIQAKRLTFINPDRFRTECFCIDVDLKNQDASILAGTPDDGNAFKLQTVRDQANAAIKKGKNVVAAVNGDYYNMATGEPQGPVIKNGEIVHDNVCHEPFFGIQKDGTPIISDDSVYQQKKNQLKEAIGGPRILVKNGVAIHYNDSPYPCAAVGIRSDKSVFFLCVDGAQYPYSDGIALKDLADLLKDMGAEQALMLDGGGSATCVTRTPGETDLSCKNSPSDGWERKVGNSFLIVSNRHADCVFASAYITPQDKTYTPKSVVQMQAVGLDSSGAPANLPDSGLTWSLSDPTFGTIDENGKLTSSGKKGQTQVCLKYNGKTVGSTHIEFALPDELYFSSKSLSMDLNASHSLNLIARYQGRDVNLNDDDIKWEIPSGLGKIEDHDTLDSGGKAASGTITATLTGKSLSAKIDVTVGQTPVVVCDFENPDDYKSWYSHAGKRNETCSCGLSTYPEEPVRFGNHALKLNFDFTTGQKESTLVTYAGAPDHVELPGTPTAIGMWVYAPPEARGEWLWTGVYDNDGNRAIANGGYLVSQQTGINWTGWKYVEAPIKPDAVFPVHIGTGAAIGVLCVKSGMPGGCPMTKGTIYVDNIRAVYGANNDDVTPPVIESITTDGKQYNKSQVDITAYVHDDNKDNASGINWDRSKIIVDGTDYSTDKTHFSYDASGSLSLTGLNWLDGVHKVTVDTQDNFGNETTRDTYFTVNNGTGVKINFAPDSGQALLGGDCNLTLKADRASNIKSISAKIQISKKFPVSGVTFASAVQANSTYTYNKDTGLLNLNIVKGSDPIPDASKLAIIHADIPKDAPSGSQLECSIQNASIMLSQNEGDDFSSSFSSKPIDIPISSAYQLQMQTPIVGGSAKILVTDAQDKPVRGAVVSELQGDGSWTTLGTTDADGMVSDSNLTESILKFNLQATKDQQYSFIQAFQSYNPVKGAAPSNLLSGTTANPKTEKSITWMSNPLTSANQALMELAPQTDYRTNGEKAFQKFSGASTILYYNDDSSAVRENSVVAAGLQSGMTYAYRVGDGEHWSDVRTFTTDSGTNQFSFNIFGDTQSTESGGLDDLSTIFSRIEQLPQKPLFTIHVGDFVDDEQIFSEIDQTAVMFNQHSVFDSIDMIHVLGNHEYQGDDGTKGSTIYGVPQNGPSFNKQGCYSTNYGNMHISVIGWTDNADVMQKELEWLQQDVKSAHKTWYVVATHQPAYNKNPDDPSTLFNKMLPPACDELGIDFVFSGHDHSYGRTFPLNDGKKVADGKGTVYISAGHTAEKTYDIAPNDPSVFAYVQSNKEDKTYLTATVNGNHMMIQAQKADGSVVDTYSTTARPHPNKASLQTAISNADAIYKMGNENNQYASDSWQSFDKKLEVAKATNENTCVDQQEVNSATEALIVATNGLQFTKEGANYTLHAIDNLDTDKPISDQEKPAIKQAVKAIKFISEQEKLTDQGTFTKLEKLLEILTQNTAQKVIPSYAPGLSDNDKIMEAPTASNLLLAAGITGEEGSIPQVILNTKQIIPKDRNEILSFQLNLSNGETKISNLLVPVTIKFKFPTSFVYHTDYTYSIRHDKEDGTYEILPLTINSGYGVFTTESFSNFTVLSTKNNSASGGSSGSGSSTSHHPSSISNSRINSIPNVPTIPSATYISDTTSDLSVNGTYQFKITSKNGKIPTFVIGTSGVFSVQLVQKSGNDYFFKIVATGVTGARAGVYVNGQKLLVATIGSGENNIKCDTTKPFLVKSGATYTFKLTANIKPSFVCGNSSIFNVKYAGEKGSNYFFKATAVGKAGARAGFYINGSKVPCTIATVI